MVTAVVIVVVLMTVSFTLRAVSAARSRRALGRYDGYQVMIDPRTGQPHHHGPGHGGQHGGPGGHHGGFSGGGHVGGGGGHHG